MLEVNAALSPCEVKDILTTTGTVMPPTPERPHEGRFLNTAKAVWEAGRRANVWNGKPYDEWLRDAG